MEEIRESGKQERRDMLASGTNDGLQFEHTEKRDPEDEKAKRSI